MTKRRALEIYEHEVRWLPAAERLQLLALIAESLLDEDALSHEALAVAGQADNTYARRLAAIQERHPRAYAPWSSDEDLQLRQLVEGGHSVDDISNRLQRQPSAIRGRMYRLRLRAEATPPRERPLHNVMEFYGRGRASWDGIDAQEYVNKLREKWDHRP